MPLVCSLPGFAKDHENVCRALTEIWRLYRRRGAVVKGFEHISTNVEVNI